MKKSILLFLFCSVLALSDLQYAQGFVCAVGGGSENYNDWSDAPYSWIVEKSGNGKVIILGVSDASSWLPGYFLSFGASTAYNKKIDSRAVANLQATYDELITANAIFIRGGNQWNYVNYWKGTKTEDAIRYVYQNGGVVAGTSAGAMVLGEIVFTSENGSIDSKNALMGPTANSVALEDNFIGLVPGVLFDTHFIERGRFGRLMAMMYKYYNSNGMGIIGAGIDDKTAICIDNNMIGTVMGSGAVSLFRMDEKTSFSSYQGSHYTIENLLCDQLTNGWSYNFNHKRIEHIPPSARPVDTSFVMTSPVSDFYLSGNNSISQQLQYSFPEFINRVNSTQLVIITNHTFSGSLSPLTTYLNGGSINYSVVYVSSQSLNDPSYSSSIQQSTAIIFAGDSLPALALLKDVNTTVGSAFAQKMNENTPVFFFGNTGKLSGSFYIDNVDGDALAAYRGRMTNNGGLSLFDDLIFQPLVFESSDYFENRTSSVLWGLMLNRKRTGIYLDARDFIAFNSADNSISGSGLLPLIITDARSTTYVDSSVYVASGGTGPRQVVGMNNLRYSFTRYSNLKYLIDQGKFESLTDIGETMNPTPDVFQLYPNYPNPFNPSTYIRYDIKQEGRVLLKIYDLPGREITTLVDEIKTPGQYEVRFSADNLASGIYLYTLFTPEGRQSRKMLLIK